MECSNNLCLVLLELTDDNIETASNIINDFTSADSDVAEIIKGGVIRKMAENQIVYYAILTAITDSNISLK